MTHPHWTIYCHTHIDSGRRYVGLTKKTMLQRWNHHVYTANRHNKKGWAHFPNAIRKYGKDAFSHEVLEILDSLEEANQAEIKWIKFYDTKNPEKGFNLKKGGAHTPHPFRNPWNRPEYRAKQLARPPNTAAMQTPESREANKTSLNTPESKAKRSASLKVSHAKPEVKAKLSKASKGRILSPEHCAKISKNNLGRRHTHESKEKMSELQRGRVHSEETKLKQSLAQKGKTIDPEVRDKISSSVADFYKSKKRSRFMGVTFHKVQRKWTAYIRDGKKRKHIGCFKTEKEAALAYNKKAQELFGSSARLNPA